MTDTTAPPSVSPPATGDPTPQGVRDRCVGRRFVTLRTVAQLHIQVYTQGGIIANDAS